MKAHTTECCHGARELPSRWSRGAFGGVLFAVAAALAVAVGAMAIAHFILD
jgi:hypothetical protein